VGRPDLIGQGIGTALIAALIALTENTSDPMAGYRLNPGPGVVYPAEIGI
jgi:hypothetical protein